MKHYILPVLFALLLAGCSRGPTEYTASFEPNTVHVMKYQIKENLPAEVMGQASDDVSWILDRLFGTPDEPKIPDLLLEDDFAGLVSMDRLRQAAGPFDIDEGSGLYRKHCVSCHGVTGNGRGENSAILDPYPRDYRHGIFKFKSTKRGAKPTREDLARSIRNGIPGTAMVKIVVPSKDIPGQSGELSEEQIQALVDYVIYLSIRGELERSLIDDAVFELDLAEGDRIVDHEFGDSLAGDGRKQIEDQVQAWEDAGKPEGDPRAELAEKLELYDESMEIADDMLADIADAWLEAEDRVVKVPAPPSDIPVANSHAEFVAFLQSDRADQLNASIERGRELFTGKIASCSKCHGEKGYGDGQNKDYDDWTKDWTTRAGLKPEDTEALIPLMARGAMPPKNALPRNFTEGVFRGGESAEDLYRRISQGIEGSPMPASTFVPGEYDQEDIWHLINFVRSVQNEDSGEPAAAI
jgi:mono/diheme cytochrome c family protein